MSIPNRLSSNSISLIASPKRSSIHYQKMMHNPNLFKKTYSKHYYSKNRIDFMVKCLFAILISINILSMTFMYFRFRFHFLLGFWFNIVIGIANFTGLLIKIFIFNNRVDWDDQNIYIYWMCCMLGKRSNKIE